MTKGNNKHTWPETGESHGLLARVLYTKQNWKTKDKDVYARGTGMDIQMWT